MMNTGVTIHSYAHARGERWYEEGLDDATRASRVLARAATLDEENSDRILATLRACALYGSAIWPGWNAYLEGRSGRVSHNVLANAADTGKAEVTQTIPRPVATTIDADYQTAQRARRLTRHWDWWFGSVGMRRVAEKVVLDGFVAGDGFARPVANYARGKVGIERVFPANVLVSGCGSSFDAEPREMFIIRGGPKDQLLAQYVETNPTGRDDDWLDTAARHIEGAAPPCLGAFLGGVDDDGETAGVVEAYRLDLGTGKGYYAITLDGFVLEEGEYPYDDFPLVRFTPLESLSGWYGESLFLRAASAQDELNKLTAREQDARHLHGNPILFLIGEGKVKPQITNDVGTIVRLPRGTTVQPYSPPTMPGDFESAKAYLTRAIYEMFGISQLTANSMKPAGLNSGKAILTYRELTSRKFINPERAVGDLYCDIARLSMRAFRRLAQLNGEQMVTLKDRGKVITVPFSHVDLDDDEVRIGVAAVNAMSKSPSARQDWLKEAYEGGFISKEEYMHQQGYHELSDEVTLLRKEELMYHDLFSRILETGVYPVEWSPGPEMNMERALVIARQHYMAGLADQAPEEHMEVLRTWMADAMPPPPPAPGPMPGGPMDPMALDPMAMDPMAGGGAPPMAVDPAGVPDGAAPGLPPMMDPLAG